MLQASMSGILQATAATAPLPGEDDRRLARGCVEGESAVFEEIYRRFGERMKSIAWNYLGNVSDAEDAVQDTFIKIHRSAGTFTGEASFATWAYRILVNTCCDLLRKRRRRIHESPMEDSPVMLGSVATNVDDAKRITLRKLLDGLPEQRRSVFTLFEIEGMSHAEIGEVLGISEGNSKWLLFATKKELQERWRSGG